MKTQEATKKKTYYTPAGKRIKIEMVKRGMTSKELAQMVGYTESTLCDVLKGRNRSERRVKELLDLLGLSEEKSRSVG